MDSYNNPYIIPFIPLWSINIHSPIPPLSPVSGLQNPSAVRVRGGQTENPCKLQLRPEGALAHWFMVQGLGPDSSQNTEVMSRR